MNESVGGDHLLTASVESKINQLSKEDVSILIDQYVPPSSSKK